MRIVDATLERFSGALARPIANAGWSWSARSGLLLTLVDGEGRVGQGECSPLPGYSPDDERSCQTALGGLDWNEVAERQRDATLLEGLAAASALLPPGLPAARFAVETALVDLAAKRAHKPAWRLLRSSVRRLDSRPLSIPLCGVLAAAGQRTDDVLDAASALWARGLGTLKLKLGYDGDIALARALRNHVGQRVLLRFDANRAWSGQEAGERLAELATLVPELVEEPTAALHALGRSPVPLALDESLQSDGVLADPCPSLFTLRVEAAVLKPAALGGLVRCIQLAARAQGMGLGVIVSHLFDGPVALAAAGALALAVASPERASGLDRHPGLEAWPDVPIALLGDTHVVPDDKAGLGIERLRGGEPLR